MTLEQTKHTLITTVKMVEFSPFLVPADLKLFDDPSIILPERLALADVLSVPNRLREPNYSDELESAMQDHASAFVENQFILPPDSKRPILKIAAAVLDEEWRIAMLLKDAFNVGSVQVADAGNVPNLVLDRFNCVSELMLPTGVTVAQEASRLSMLDLVSVISVD